MGNSNGLYNYVGPLQEVVEVVVNTHKRSFIVLARIKNTPKVDTREL
jgi:hypothetical protein